MLNLSVDSEITLLRWVGFYENSYSRSFFSKNKRNIPSISRMCFQRNGHLVG
ncbi:hypothetical protein HMPREF9431_00652 [Segatella oulorum F0390]|uniref:Uncharacterized protein n=1 Tax=Segatella oulorum F0390 TaxID=702438 RepID=G1WA01_9BACT|nr:hypothetical protein HMPREF9431_00653 [Segatella oulorum F0390]EGV34186.1 hypothetical protein HMPREF9431_00652 [Segatella oulorum F0390]